MEAERIFYRYQYVAYNESREIVKGKLEANNEEQAVELLGFAGYQVINLKAQPRYPLLGKLTRHLSPMKSSEIVLFYRQMALLLESGINIITSLELLKEQATNSTFKRVLENVISDLRAGRQLSAALNNHSDVFPAIHCRSLKVGEQTGNLETILRQIADHMEKRLTTGKSIKNAMTYPIIALVVAVVVVGILVAFVLPAFSSLYESLGAELPAITRILIDIGAMLQAYGLYILVALGMAAGTGLAYIRTPTGRYNWDKLSLRFPVVGRINHLNELSSISRSISLLFHAGLPLTEILPLIIQGTGNKVMAEALMDVREDMLRGEGLSHPMSKDKIFLPMMVQMVRVGEETGNLDNTLLSVAQNYEAAAEDKTRAFINMIQPTMTIVIGLIVGLLALSLISAMYSMYGQVG